VRAERRYRVGIVFSSITSAIMFSGPVLRFWWPGVKLKRGAL
jgi:hypothetical protein